MFSQFFGNFLLNKGYLTEKELIDVLKKHLGTHIKIGLIALNEGVLTPEQVDQIHLEQTYVDKKFGEIAVDKGYLESCEIEELLKQQKGQLKLIQTVVDNNYMDFKGIQEAVEEFREEYAIDKYNEYRVRDIDVEKLVRGTVGVDSHKLQYTTLLMRNINRLIGSYVFIADDKDIENSIKGIDKEKQIVKVSQSIRGSLGLNIEMYMTDETSKYISKNINKDDLDVTEKEAIEGFVAINTGMYVISLLSDGLKVNMDSQSRGKMIEYEEFEKVMHTEKVIVVSINEGKIFLVYR